MRKFLFAVVFLLGGLFVTLRFAEVQQIADTLKQGDIRYIALALFFQAIWILNIAASYKVIYLAMGLEEKYERLILISTAANFVNVIAPSAGMGGMAVFISEAKRRGYSSGRVTAAGVLAVLFDYLGFFVLLILGLFILFRRNYLSITEIIPSVILFLMASFLAYLIVIGVRSAESLGNVLSNLSYQVNRFSNFIFHRKYLSEQRAQHFAEEVSSALKAITNRPKYLTVGIVLGLSSKVILVVNLALVFLAFNVPFSPGTIIAGFSIGYLFWIVSPTPAGIGFVEGGLTLALTTLNVPLGAAAVITLAFRGITFWIPLLFGMIAFRVLPHTGELQSESDFQH
jgi:glycosyltransferase 2 family protein